MNKLKVVVTIAVWVLFLKGLFNVVASLVAGFTNMMSMEIVEVMGGLGIAALILACIGAWLRKKLEEYTRSNFQRQSYIVEVTCLLLAVSHL